MSKTATLLIHCPDRPGIVAGISNFLFVNGANILHADQHQDNDRGLFFMRVEFELAKFALDQAAFRAQFGELAKGFGMKWRIAYSAQRPAMAIFVSQYLHCLVDLLYRHKLGELPCTIPFIISNHRDAEELAAFYGIPFRYMPVDKSNKGEIEAAQLAYLRDCSVELVVLARYMQILSPGFVTQYSQQIINVHHSFLPAFTGARPYHAAYERGVKLIGATSHYVTEVLDEGPIIEQDVVRVSHRDQVEDLVQKGRDMERMVLSRAVKWHLENRILHYESKTVIFD